MRFEVCVNLRRRSDEVFLELLGKFAHQCNLDIAKDKLDFFDELVDVVRACVENLCCFFVFQLLEQVDALGAFLGRDPVTLFEEKSYIMATVKTTPERVTEHCLSHLRRSFY